MMGSIQEPTAYQQQPEPNMNRSFNEQGSSSNVDMAANIGYDFENHHTRLQLELMDDLQKLGVSKYLDLPQLVVMGEQSTGKSSVLQAVTEIPFLTDDKMCTRFATEIVLRRTAVDTTTKIEVCIIPDNDETSERKELLGGWRPVGFDPNMTLTKENMKGIFEQAQEIIFEQPNPSPGRRNNSAYLKSFNRLSSSTLRITRSGPRETNFAIVDIPGLVRGQKNSEHSTAKKLVKKYLDNIRSIIVVVIDVVDLERHEIFDLIAELPDKESRVVGVINKCDTKQQQSSDWVFDLIRNDQARSLQYLKEGWYGLRNRAASELLISDAERDELENQFFAGDDWVSLDAGRLGRHHLKKALIKMRNEHIKRSIPELLSEIDRRLDKCATRMEYLGEPRSTSTAQFSMVNKIANNYSNMASAAIDGHYRNLRNEEMYARKLIRDNLDTFQANMIKGGYQKPFRSAEEDAKHIIGAQPDSWAVKFLEIPTYSWIRKAVKDNRATEDGDEVNPDVKIELWKVQTTSWESISFDALRAVETAVASVNRAIFAAACPDNELRPKLLSWLHDDFAAASKKAKAELKQILQDEKGGIMTLNPLKVQNQITYRDWRIQAIKAQFAKVNPAAARPLVAQPALELDNISADIVINSLINQNPDLVGILNTHDSIAAYYNISLYRFIDNFAMQVVERHLLGPEGPLRLFSSDYVTRKLHGEENATALNELAGERPEVGSERRSLDLEMSKLNESRKKVIAFRTM